VCLVGVSCGYGLLPGQQNYMSGRCGQLMCVYLQVSGVSGGCDLPGQSEWV
jgi:hypothetical protein